MAKNYASIYDSGNDSIALEQKFYIKQETTRGVLAAPAPTDFLYTLAGGSTNFSQAFESSPHRSGRHHNNIIKQKKITEWSIPAFFNIDPTASINAAYDDPMAVLWQSLLGNQTDNDPVDVCFDATVTPDITFSIYEVGDAWAKQSPGGFANTGEITLPGDGQSQVTFGGNAKTSYMVGIGKCETNGSGGNTVTLAADEGLRFPEGALVMLVDYATGTKIEGTDTAPRTVTAVSGDVVTIDGAALVVDGSLAPFLLVYWEPDTNAAAIDNPLTGLQGSISASNTVAVQSCVRSLTMSITNNHELVDYCFGEDGLAGPLFVPGGRLDVSVSMEVNLNSSLVAFYNDVLNATPTVISAILGDTAENYAQFDMPRVIFSAPNVSVPETGSIPVTFEGMAYQSALDAADEFKVCYKAP